MAGAFSGYLVNSFYNADRRRPSFGQNGDESQISIHRPMSFNPGVHGNFSPLSNFSMVDNTSASMMYDISEETAVKIATLQAKLNKKLGPEYISQRPGPSGGPKLTYAEGWKIINLANEVFGFNGWSTSIVNLTTDFVDFSEETRRYCIGVTSVIRVTLRDGVFHEDVGYGMLENSKSKGAALDKCKKEAVTDGVKRALRNFGNLLGNCLYDKEYTKEIVKVKVQPAKFDKDSLHRRPEFDDSKSKYNTSATSIPTTDNNTSPSKSAASTSHIVKIEPTCQPHGNPASALPTHLKPTSSSTPNGKGKTTVSPRDAEFTFDSGIDPAPPKANQQTTHTESTLKLNNQPQRHIRPPHVPAPAAPSRPPQILPRALSPRIDADLDMDDTFSFPSEDDAFLASLDLAELDADLGRPIDYDDGPTDREREHPDTSSASEGGSSEAKQKEGSTTGGLVQGGLSKHSISAVSHGLLSSNSASVTSASGRHPAQNHNLTLGGQPKPNSGGSEERQATRPPVGGFKFPPGTNLQTLRTSSIPPRTVNVSGVGIKRTADVMQQQQPAAGARRVSPGMGLSNAVTGSTSNSSGPRDVLRTLYVEPLIGGSDPKRVKR